MFGVEITDSPYVVALDADHDPDGREGPRARWATTPTFVPLPALGRRTARARASRTSPWPCNDDEVHHPVPRGADDLELRLRLRRQRAAGQEVLLAAHRLGDGPRRGLARRAHADPQADLARAAGPLRRRGVPERLRQDQPRDARADHRGLEGRDARRRHRLDALRRGRPALRGQPRVRPVRRRAGHRLEHQPQRDAHDRQGQLDVHQRRAHRRRRHLVGGHDRRAAGAPHRLEGPRLDAGRPTSRRSHPNSRFCTPITQCPILAPEYDDPQRRADLGDPLRRPPQDDDPAGHRGARLGARRLHGRDAVVGDHRRRDRRRSASCAATRWRCCRSSATTPATTSATGSRWARAPTPPSCRRSSTSTGSAATTTAASSGPASARTAACSSGSIERIEGRAAAVETADRPRADAGVARRRRAWT